MSEKLFNNEDHQYNFTVDVNWYGSKLVVAQFVRRCAEELEIDDLPASIITEGFIHDLSHRGRGLQDFPMVFPLHVPNTGDNVEINGKAFYQQLIDQVVDYLAIKDEEYTSKPHVPWDKKPTEIYGKSVEALMLLSDHYENTNFMIYFKGGHFDQERQEIASIHQLYSA